METLSRKQILLASKEALVNIVLKLQKGNKRLRKENEELPEPLNRPAKHSHNSSKPSSIDIVLVQKVKARPAYKTKIDSDSAAEAWHLMCWNG